ncbi:AtzE family amidohydrolase [Labrys wisconsinensis]|uniref:Aspartyl-tRNA(Asn)/glutamyl-tRNA(Gln) amidotransferase subunit A n=1 Tax=Labrys wisconsinensis TaxID=425677 RepID=A0ABU0J0D0_9HYPH|nr:AtzE family amidohydrolase [Labrys wisconsinensis]MDQ0467725.1 aspartyl-tRNA(Asn)/glutamyl-tRNA(Gln) amidotransferase subunit A [Labrys wisconsinensis]
MSATDMTASEIAAAVAAGSLRAVDAVGAALDRIAAHDEDVGAFTDVLAERALARASAVDAARMAGKPLGPLAGVPFAVKNLFDLQGIPTLAGSRINRDDPPAARDAALVERLEAAGAVCLGGLNMGEYAYDFTGENLHDGPSCNPHDLGHMSGGSSGGSGSAVAAGFVPLSLGSDTNGSIRVPASLCGLFGLKPTFGRLSRARSFPFVASLDHLGPLARSVADLALAYDVMQGPDPDDPHCAGRPAEPVLPRLAEGAEGLTIAIAGGYFAEHGEPEAFAAVARCAAALGADRVVELPEAHRARAAAFLITTTEGAALHLERLRRRPGDFDPAVRDRLIAGAMIPASFVAQAHKFRRWFQGAVAELFETVDIVLAPATPCRAPKLGQAVMSVGGEMLPVRANLGLYTQPISFIGLPVAAVPVWTAGERLPIGVQVIGPAWREDLVLRVAGALEAMGIAAAPVARL